MSQTRSLRLKDARAALRILNECRELGADAVEWRRHLADSLRSLFKARLCTVGESWGDWRNRLKEVAMLIPSGVDSEVESTFRAHVENNAALGETVPLRLSRPKAKRITVATQRAEP